MGGYGFIIWPLVAEVLSLLAMVGIALVAHRPLEKEYGRSSAILRRDRSWAARIDQDGMVRSRHVFRVIEVLVILYHFPVLMVTSVFRRDPPTWAWMGLTPVLYGAAWWLLFTRGH